MKTLASFRLQDHLEHTWRQQLVSFPLPADAATAPRLAVVNESGATVPYQVSQGQGAVKLFFAVDTLPALGSRTFALKTGGRKAKTLWPQPKARPQGQAVVLGNGLVSVRVPAARAETAAFPAPVLGIRRGTGPWLGEGRFMLSDRLQPAALTSECVESGPLWLTWRLQYLCKGGERYTVEYKLFTGREYVEITEISELGRDSRWEFSLKKGLAPDHSWTHPHQVHGDEGRLRPLPFADARHRADVGSVQFPVYSGIWVPDDYYYCGFLAKDGPVPVCVAAAGVNGGFWDYPYENQIDICFSEKRDAYFRLSIKSGHRRWLLLATDREETVGTRPFYRNTIHSAIKGYETPLDKVKDWVLAWEDLPAAARPFLLANRQQLRQAQQSAHSYGKFRDYVAALNPDLPGDYTYYHAGTHRIFTPDRRNDPSVLYVVAETAAERQKQARFLKDVVMTGLADRRVGMLDHVGHCDPESASINIGRGLRPWVALYDFAAAEEMFTAAEQKLARATFAFYCYKIMDPDFWPADHLLFRDDHPRSAHRTHWFPGRQSDWAFYNIDNIPHNFHGDLWSAAGCVAMALPTHPESRKWVNRTLEWWESELTQWVFPEGAWLESSTYTLNSMKDYLIYCRALANSHIRDYFTDERLQRVFRFYAETLMPRDARINAASIPVLGDAGYPNGFGYVIGWMAGLTGADPDYSGMLQAVWRQTGEFLTEPGRFGLNFCDFLFINPALGERPAPARVSKHYHGLGVMLRHAADTAADIYAFVKAGIIYSHFHEPEGTFLLWWNGVPLCDEYGVQYGKGTSEMSQHNCVQVRSGDWACYNKGDATATLFTEAFDYVRVDAPILQAWLQPGQWVWGYRGEMAPTGWHRRHFLLVKPFYVYIYDDLECPLPTTYHLNVKARDCRQDGAGIHFDGRHGVDMEFRCLDLAGREIRHSEFDVELANSAFVPPPDFYRQRQIHIDGAPNQHYATLLLPHRPDVAAAVENDPETGGASVTLDGRRDRAMLFPAPRRLDTAGLVFDGTAGIVRTLADGRLALLQVSGTRLGIPGQLVIDGDGPYVAEFAADGSLTLTTSGIGRWLTLGGGASFASATVDGQATTMEPGITGGQRLYVPAGSHCFSLRNL